MTVINVRLRSENSVEMAKPSFYALKGSYLKIADRIKIGLSDQSTSNSVKVILLDATMTLKALDIAETSKISTTLGDTEQVLHLDLSKY